MEERSSAAKPSPWMAVFVSESLPVEGIRAETVYLDGREIILSTNKLSLYQFWNHTAERVYWWETRSEHFYRYY